MKTLSLPYATNKALKTPGRQHESAQYQDAASVLIVFTSDGTDSKFKILRKLQSKFQIDKKRVSFLYLLLKNEDRPSVGLDNDMIALETKDIGYFGDIKNEAVNSLMTTNYDFMICGDMGSNIYLDLLIAKIQSKCKIGRYMDSKDKFYDFMIQIDHNCDLEFYLNQVYHYTKLF